MPRPKKQRRKLSGDTFRKQSQIYLYTKGKEFSLNGREYVGEYHYDNGVPYVGPVHRSGAPILQKYYGNSLHYTYDTLFKFDVVINRYVNPKPYRWTPREDEYLLGSGPRYFVEKRNDDYSYAIEIDQQQYEKIDLLGGIDGGLYHYTRILWRLTGTAQEVARTNEKALRDASKIVPSIEYAVRNYVEYARIL